MAYGQRVLKRHPDGRVYRAWYVPVEDCALALQLDVGVGDGDGREEGLGVGMERVCVELVAGAISTSAEVHDPDAVGDVLDHREVVGDEQVGQVPLPL